MQKARSQSPPRGEPPGAPPTACKHVVSGSISLPALGCFSPVPHGTRPLSVTRESLALEGGPPSFTPRSSKPWRYSGTPLASVRWLGLPGCHRLWRRFPADFRCRLRYRPWVLQPRSHKEIGLGSAPFARRYWGHLG